MPLLRLAPEHIAAGRQNDEEQSEHDVAQVRVEVVKVRQLSERLGAQEVVVAQILIASIV